MNDSLISFVNSGIENLQPYEPGRSIEEVAADYNPEKIVKLASNENRDRILLDASAASTDEGEHLLLDSSAATTDVGFFVNTEIGTTETPPEGFVGTSSIAASSITTAKTQRKRKSLAKKL